MRRCMLTVVLLVSLAGIVYAEPFFLVDRDSDKRYGPFEFKHGATIVIGKQVFLIQRPGGETEARGLAVEARMQAIKILQIDLRQSSIRDAIEFIKKRSMEFDNPKMPQNEKGINFVLNLQGMDEKKVALITFSANNISVQDALSAITSSAGLQYRIDGAIVFIEPRKSGEKP
jgi:hypothetical protein